MIIGNSYELLWYMLKSVIDIHMRMIWYIRWIMWNGYDLWKVWLIYKLNDDECPWDNMKVYDTWDRVMTENEQK